MNEAGEITRTNLLDMVPSDERASRRNLRGRLDHSNSVPSEGLDEGRKAESVEKRANPVRFPLSDLRFPANFHLF